MGLLSTAWALLLYQWVDDHTRILATLLIFVGSMGSAYCLASVPAAARLNLLVSTAPLAVRLMLAGETFSVCFGINLLLLLALFVRMMNLHYADFAMRVASRVRLTAERERLRTARQDAVAEQHKQRDLAARFDTAIDVFEKRSSARGLKNVLLHQHGGNNRRRKPPVLRQCRPRVNRIAGSSASTARCRFPHSTPFPPDWRIVAISRSPPREPPDGHARGAAARQWRQR